jgi:hypothetical protein
MSRIVRLALRVVQDEPDQVARLARFRAPGVVIREGLGYW